MVSKHQSDLLQSAADLPKANPTSEIRLLSKAEVVEKVGLSFPTLWGMMRRGEFPIARTLASRPAWLASEVEDFINNLPTRKYKAAPD